MNTKEKGDVAVAHAIAAYTDMGYEVLLPLGDKQEYDLVVDTGTELKKVQVKFAGKGARGKCQAQLRTVGGNQSFQTIKKYSDNSFDLLFVWTSENEGYNIPWCDIAARNSITVNSPKYENYKL